jgi:ribonuclease P protein component
VLLVVVAPNGLEHSRLGLSVGRVIWKSAVKRNRVRRVFREAFRLSYPELPRGLDVILIPARPKLDPELRATRAELVDLVARAARRIGEPRPAARTPRVEDSASRARAAKGGVAR